MKTRYLTKYRKKQLKKWAKEYAEAEDQKHYIAFNKKKGRGAIEYWEVLNNASNTVSLFFSKENGKKFERNINKLLLNRFILEIAKIFSNLVDVRTRESLNIKLITYRICYPKKDKAALKKIFRAVNKLIREEG